MDFIVVQSQESVALAAAATRSIVSPLISPALRLITFNTVCLQNSLLVALQRELLGSPQLVTLLMPYTQHIISCSVSFVTKTLAVHSLSNENIDQCLRNSFLGVTLPGLCTALCRYSLYINF